MSNSSLVNIDLRTKNVTNCCGFMNHNEGRHYLVS